MKAKVFPIAVLVAALLGSVPALAADPVPAVTPAAEGSKGETPVKPQVKQEAVHDLDARINNLQNTRDCIKESQTKESIQRCRANLRSLKTQTK